MKELEIYIDGASKGNPGPSAIGVIICQEGNVIKNISSSIGRATNNVAEYTALIYALEEALIMRADSVKINTDSQLLACQLNGEYKVKNPHIRELYNKATRLISALKEFNIRNIPREENVGADKLASKAIKDKINFDSRDVAALHANAKRKVRAPQE